MTGPADLYPQATLRWNNGVHNFIAYTMAGIPVGAYEADRLANVGTNHWAVDAGGGYTYLNQKTGLEFSAVLGFTYNFENPDTDYQNGISCAPGLGRLAISLGAMACRTGRLLLQPADG